MGAHIAADGSGTALQARGLQVRFSAVYLEFFFALYFWLHYGLGVNSFSP